MSAPSPPPSVRLSPQILILIGGLWLWTIWPQPYFWSFLAAYGTAWLVLNFALRRRTTHLPLYRWQTICLLILLLITPLTHFTRLFPSFGWLEGLRGIQEHLQDRSQLETLPSIFPAVIVHDRPQRFYIHAPDSKRVSVDFGLESLLAAEPLGHGLFRVTYNPHQDGPPLGPSASLQVDLHIDKQPVSRELTIVRHEAHPRWFASAPAQGLASTVSEETDEVFILSRMGLKHRLSVGDGPTDTAFFDYGSRLAVSHRYSEEVWLLDVETGKVMSKIPLAPFQVRLVTSPDESWLAVALAGLQPGIQFLALPTGQAETFIPLDFAPDWIAFGPSSNTLVISSAEERALYVLSRTKGSQVWTQSEPLRLGRPVVTMSRSLDGATLYVATTDYRPDGEEHRGNHFIQDQILTIDIPGWEVTGQFLTARRSERQTQAGSVDRGVSPMGIGVREDESLLIAFAGTDEVWQVEPDFYKPLTTLSGDDFALITPHGVADLGDGYWAASTPAGGVMAVYDASNALVAFEGVAPADADLAAEDEDSLARRALRIRAGERAFYESTRAGLACQSCHLHAATDHSPHDIGQRPLLHTLTVRGIAGTAPYLKDASFPRIRDLNDHLALTLYRGYERSMKKRNVLLEDYVKSLSRDVNPVWLEKPNLELEKAGLDAFVKAHCTLCHTFPAFTNLSQHPIRAVFPDYGETQLTTSKLDTPSLLGVHAKTHFLQDGRAHNLQEVLDEYNEANRHGDTARLSEEEKRALIYFLRTL